MVEVRVAHAMGQMLSRWEGPVPRGVVPAFLNCTMSTLSTRVTQRGGDEHQVTDSEREVNNESQGDVTLDARSTSPNEDPPLDVSGATVAYPEGAAGGRPHGENSPIVVSDREEGPSDVDYDYEASQVDDRIIVVSSSPSEGTSGELLDIGIGDSRDFDNWSPLSQSSTNGESSSSWQGDESMPPSDHPVGRRHRRARAHGPRRRCGRRRRVR